MIFILCASAFSIPLFFGASVMKAREAGKRESLFIIHIINNNNNYAFLDIRDSRTLFLVPGAHDYADERKSQSLDVNDASKVIYLTQTFRLCFPSSTLWRRR